MIDQADLFPEVRLTPEDDTDSRFTPRPFILEMERKQGFRFDLDVAACAEAHHATRYYTKADNGLVQPWDGHVWCNPPFSDIEPWVVRAWDSIWQEECLSITMLLPVWTDRKWWQKHVEPRRDRPGSLLTTEFLPRFPFGFPGNPDAIGVGQPEFFCVLLRWRR